MLFLSQNHGTNVSQEHQQRRQEQGGKKTVCPPFSSNLSPWKQSRTRWATLRPENQGAGSLCWVKLNAAWPKKGPQIWGAQPDQDEVRFSLLEGSKLSQLPSPCPARQLPLEGEADLRCHWQNGKNQRPGFKSCPTSR